MFNFADCTDKCLGQQWRFAVTGSEELVPELSMYPGCALYFQLTMFTQIWIDSHPITCCFLFLLLPVLSNFFKCASWVIFSVATIALSRWTNWCLRCCSVSPRGALREAPVVRLDSAPIAPGGIVLRAMACCCRNVRKMLTKRSGKS